MNAFTAPHAVVRGQYFKMEDGSKQERDRDSYLRWQKIAIEQLGYVINLFLTLSGAVLAFAVKTMMASSTPLPPCAHCLFGAALLVLAISIWFSLAANITRALDFRYTRRAAHARWKEKPEHDALQDKADMFGKWTWCLFYWQTGAFARGVASLFLSIWIGYSHKI
jgi:hypothetical protein